MVAGRPVRLTVAAALPLVLISAGCSPNMRDQPKYKSLAESKLFNDGRAAQPALPGTVARGHLKTDRRFFTGKAEAGLVGTVPLPVDRALLARGRERFGIFCTPCHGLVGDGNGMVVQRGLRQPPSFHIERLREAPDGHYFDVMTAGYGAMASYASRIPPRDRWAITAYIRALQLSQNAKLEDVPAEQRSRLLGKTQ
jgi:mono/diheme cytochrome c family protein